MKRTVLTTITVATLLCLNPILASDRTKPKTPAKKQSAETPCLDREIDRLEATLQSLAKGISESFDQQQLKLEESEVALEKSKAECATLRKNLAASQAHAQNLETEFNAFKASAEKQRQALIHRMEKLQQATRAENKAIADLKQKNAKLDKAYKDACAKLAAIVDQLEQANDNVSKRKRKK